MSLFKIISQSSLSLDKELSNTVSLPPIKPTTRKSRRTRQFYTDDQVFQLSLLHKQQLKPLAEGNLSESCSTEIKIKKSVSFSDPIANYNEFNDSQIDDQEVSNFSKLGDRNTDQRFDPFFSGSYHLFTDSIFNFNNFVPSKESSVARQMLNPQSQPQFSLGLGSNSEIDTYRNLVEEYGFKPIATLDDGNCLFNVFSLILIDLAYHSDSTKTRISAYLDLKEDDLFLYPLESLEQYHIKYAQQYLTKYLRIKLTDYFKNLCTDLTNGDTILILENIRCSFNSLPDAASYEQVKLFYLEKIRDDHYWLGLESSSLLSDMLFDVGIYFNDHVISKADTNKLAHFIHLMNPHGMESNYGFMNFSEGHFTMLKKYPQYK